MLAAYHNVEIGEKCELVMKYLKNWLT